MSKKQLTALILLDFSKAFDTINYSILTDKLRKYGVQENEWFLSYLSGRAQQTKVNESLSDSETVLAGCPQGSVLSPLLFLIYTADLCKVMSHVQVRQYADDTQLFLSFSPNEGESWESAALRVSLSIGDDLKAIQEWAKANCLKLNPSKTEFLLIGSEPLRKKANMMLDFGGAPLEPVDKAKSLGVILDSNMTFNEHIDLVCKRMASKLGQLYGVKGCLSFRFKKALVQSLVLSHLNYCELLYLSTTKQNRDRLQRIQNWAARFVCNADRMTSALPLIRRLKWQTVNELYMLRLSKMTWQCANKPGQLPSYITEKFEFRDDIRRKTRYSTKATVAEPDIGRSNSFGQRMFKWRSARLANTIGQEGLLNQPLATFQQTALSKWDNINPDKFSLY